MSEKKENQLFGRKVMKGGFTLLIVAVMFAMMSCQGEKNEPDAYGVFEAEEITVFSENNGKLLVFNVEEGKHYEQGAELGCIDTMQLYLQMRQLEASINAALAKRPDMPSQIKALQDKLETLEKEKVRVSNLVAANAASAQQLDEINAEINITNSQILATKSTLSTTTNSILEEVEAMRFQKMQIERALSKCKITAPISGVILKKFINEEELVFQGKPLFKIADLTNMYIKVYVTEDILSSLRLGQDVEINLDTQEAGKKLQGKISWISPKAEFTPKMIQTKKERVNLVYAVKVAFVNDGSAKIGMPGDVVFK